MNDKLDKCFQGTKGIPPRLIQKKPDIDKAESHLDKEELNVAAMETMFQTKFFDWSIVTAYYSMYHATLAALWLIGIDAQYFWKRMRLRAVTPTKTSSRSLASSITYGQFL
jgi:hypothetical protein